MELGNLQLPSSAAGKAGLRAMCFVIFIGLQNAQYFLCLFCRIPFILAHLKEEYIAGRKIKVTILKVKHYTGVLWWVSSIKYNMYYFWLLVYLVPRWYCWYCFIEAVMLWCCVHIWPQMMYLSCTRPSLPPSQRGAATSSSFALHPADSWSFHQDQLQTPPASTKVYSAPR